MLVVCLFGGVYMVLIVEFHFFSELKLSMEEWLDDVYYVCNCKRLINVLS